MTKRKKASSSTSRPVRGSRPSGSGRTVARVTKSNGTPDPEPSTPETAPSPQPHSTSPHSGTRLTLAAECMVSEATSLKERLAALLDEPQPVTLDAAALQRIDTASLQVITAFIRERAGAGRAVEWQGTSPVLTTAAQLLGLTSLLRLPA